MNHPFTFGIITDASRGPGENMIGSVCSIRELQIPEYEIIIVGEEKQIRKCSYLDATHTDIKIIDFNEKIRPGHITKKKNLITKHAKFDSIVYQHDYFRYDKQWYNQQLAFGNEWKLQVCQILNYNGSRYREWCLWIYPKVIDALRQSGLGDRDCLLPYWAKGVEKFQYISGAYWLAKKHVMEEFPLNESLAWGEGEDLEFSRRVFARYTPVMNPLSIVQLAKDDRHAVFEPMDPEKFETFKRILLS